MEEGIDDIVICRYEVGTIINENRNTIMCTNDLDTATKYYEKIIEKIISKNENAHVIVFLYDYDKNTNINYYDSEVD